MPGQIAEAGALIDDGVLVELTTTRALFGGDVFDVHLDSLARDEEVIATPVFLLCFPGSFTNAELIAGKNVADSGNGDKDSLVFEVVVKTFFAEVCFLTELNDLLFEERVGLMGAGSGASGAVEQSRPAS